MIYLFIVLLGIELVIFLLFEIYFCSIFRCLDKINESINDLNKDLVDSLDGISSRIYSLKDN